MRSSLGNTFWSRGGIRQGSSASHLWRMDILKQISGPTSLASGNTSLRQNSALARPFNLVIDIQSKLQSKGVGYQRWASVYNLKQMSKTLLFLRDHKIESMEQLDQMVMQQVAKRDVLLTSIQQSEKRLMEIGTLKKHIINYSKTRSTYEEYRKVGYSKRFLEAHREEITLHKAAKATFDEVGVKKLPKVKKLSIDYAEVLTAKKQTYAEYRQVKNEAQELLIAQRNIASLYDAERKEEEQKRQKEDQIH